MTLVLDASLTVAWYFEDESTDATDALLQRVTATGAVVPSLWRLEVASAFQSAIRRKRIDTAYRDRSLARLAQLPVKVDADAESHTWSTTLRLADQFGLTIYDATYLELALRLGLPLATLDQPLRKAGGAIGITLLGLAS